MRFAYIDSQGKEVAIPSVDALRLRIALKAIVEDTVFYDSTSARWAPAEEHEIFRTLKKELGEQDDESFVAPPPDMGGDQPAVPAETGELISAELEVEELDPFVASEGEHDDEEDWRFDISNAPADRPDTAPPDPPTPLGTSSWIDVDESDEPNADFDLDAMTFGEGPGDDTEGSGELDLVPELGGPAPPEAIVPDEGSDDPEPDEADEISFDVAGGLQLEGDGPDDDATTGAGDDALPDFVEPTHVGGSNLDAHDAGGAPLEGLSQDRFDPDDELEAAGWGDEPPPSTPIEEELEVEGLPEIVDPTPARGEPRRSGEENLPVPSREELAARRRAETPGGGGARPKPGPPPRRRSASRSGGALVAIVGVLAVAGGAGWFVLGRGGDGGDVEPEPLPEVNVQIPDLPVALEPSMRAIADEARRLSLDALRSHHASSGVPAEPDPDWLAGVYLANASRYPGVERYWSEMGSYLRAMQAADDSIFTAEVGRLVQASELAAEDRERVEERIIAGYRATARDRGVVFQRARAVSEAALRLHAFLVNNEDRIAYEPGVGGLSADPVLEAIPDTPELGEAMWARVGDITEAMDAIDFLDRVTTERLVAAIVQRLGEIPLR